MQEVQEYFANYMVNDSLGIIANAHTAFADKEPKKAMSNPCIQLAKLFSIAVDFPKTGVPALILANLRVQEYPDLMDKADKVTYQSDNVLGNYLECWITLVQMLRISGPSPIRRRGLGKLITLTWKLKVSRSTSTMHFITRTTMT